MLLWNRTSPTEKTDILNEVHLQNNKMAFGQEKDNMNATGWSVPEPFKCHPI